MALDWKTLNQLLDPYVRLVRIYDGTTHISSSSPAR
jgi:hypothetical protein